MRLSCASQPLQNAAPAAARATKVLAIVTQSVARSISFLIFEWDLRGALPFDMEEYLTTSPLKVQVFGRRGALSVMRARSPNSGNLPFLNPHRVLNQVLPLSQLVLASGVQSPFVGSCH